VLCWWVVRQIQAFTVVCNIEYFNTMVDRQTFLQCEEDNPEDNFAPSSTDHSRTLLAPGFHLNLPS
jgi:hypothetical protein